MKTKIDLRNTTDIPDISEIGYPFILDHKEQGLKLCNAFFNEFDDRVFDGFYTKGEMEYVDISECFYYYRLEKSLSTFDIEH